MIDIKDIEKQDKAGENSSITAAVPAKTIDLATLIAPLAAFPSVFEAINDKEIDETRIALLQQLSSNKDTDARKAIHSVLIDMEWHFSTEKPTCGIMFEEMTSENKSRFIIFLSGFENTPTYTLYLKENLIGWLNIKKTYPVTGLPLNLGEMAYLQNVHGIDIDNPLVGLNPATLIPAVQSTMADYMAEYRWEFETRGTWAVAWLIFKECAALGVIGCIIVYAGFCALLIPAHASVYVTNLTTREHRPFTDLFNISPDNRNSGFAYACTYMVLFSAIFTALFVTGAAQSMAEDFIESTMPNAASHSGMLTTYFAVCFASLISSLPLYFSILLAGKSLESKVNRLFGEDHVSRLLASQRAAGQAATEQQPLLLSRPAQAQVALQPQQSLIVR